MNIEQAKKLLKKGKELGDEDLINMALEILGIETESNEEVSVGIHSNSSLVQIPPKSPKELPDFTMRKNPDGNGKKYTKGEPVGGFINKWVDEGEHKDIKTPEYVPMPRERPEVRPTRLQCAECGKVVEQIIISSMESEFFRCSDCKRVK